MIATSAGFVPIEDVEVGDSVWSVDENGLPVLGSVTALVFNVVSEYLVINDRIRVTPSHRFMVRNANRQGQVTSLAAAIGSPIDRGYHALGVWRHARELRVGDTLVGLDGGSIEIRRVEVRHEYVRVYNFEVDRQHNYFADGVLVHNACPDIQE